MQVHDSHSRVPLFNASIGSGTDVPKISVVVPSFNQGAYIEETLASILGQGWPRLELIVIDGGSTDQTAQVIDKYRQAITYFVSERDHGQADAINKGFRVATGDIFAWLNSDDMYLPCALQKAAARLGSAKHSALVTGGVLCMSDQDAKSGAFLPYPFDREAIRTRDRNFQAATFWTRSLWEAAGELDASLRYALDWEWFIRAAQHCDFMTLNDFLAIYRVHATQKSTTADLRRREEIIGVVEKYGGAEWAAAYRDVAANFDRLTIGLDRLRRFGLLRLRTLMFRDLYRRHGGRVKTALAQFKVSLVS